MKQEEKQLLLKDLCSRLPYGVICKLSCKLYAKGANISINEKLDTGGLEHFIFGTMEVLPYLRTMSSMTEEECKELGNLSATIENVGEILPNAPYYIEVARPEQIDWLNAHHFDYRMLIDKGLALEALKDMYKND